MINYVGFFESFTRIDKKMKNAEIRDIPKVTKIPVAKLKFCKDPRGEIFNFDNFKMYKNP